MPVETALNGTPHLDQVRSISIFGLSDVKLYFNFDSRLLSRPAGGAQPPADAHSAEQSSAAAFALVAHRRDLPLSTHRPRLHAQRAQGHAGLARSPRTQTGSRHHRHHHLRRNHAAVPGRDRPQQTAGYGLTLDAGRQRHSEQQCQRRRQLPHARQSKRQRARHRAAEIASTTSDRYRRGGTERRPDPVRDVGKVKEGFQPRLGKVGRYNENRHRARHRSAAEGRKIPARPEGAEGRRSPSSTPAACCRPACTSAPSTTAPSSSNRTTHTVAHIVLTGLVLVTLVLLVHAGRPAHHLHRRRHHSLRRALRLRHDGAHRAAPPISSPSAQSTSAFSSMHRSSCLKASTASSHAASPGEETGDLIVEGVADAPRRCSSPRSSSWSPSFRSSPCRESPDRSSRPCPSRYGFALTRRAALRASLRAGARLIPLLAEQQVGDG